MPILSITVVGLIAPRTAEADRTRPEPMGGRVEGVAALRAVAGSEIPERIVAFEAADSRLPMTWTESEDHIVTSRVRYPI